MQKRVKKSTSLPYGGEETRLKLVRSARQHVRIGGTAAEFAREHGLSRSTVASWCKGHHGPRGRPRKLPSFNETKILRLLFDEKGLHCWESVKRLIMRQSGEELSRKSVFRLLARWELNHRNGGKPGRILLLAEPWRQPVETVDGQAAPLGGMLWRILSGRGVEAFMLTSSECEVELEHVATAVVEWQKGRRSRLEMTHPELARHLRLRQ